LFEFWVIFVQIAVFATQVAARAYKAQTGGGMRKSGNKV
jgi:hypothetical protein